MMKRAMHWLHTGFAAHSARVSGAAQGRQPVAVSVQL